MKFCERFKDHALVIVHGDLNAVTFLEAAKNAFIQKGDDNDFGKDRMAGRINREMDFWYIQFLLITKNQIEGSSFLVIG